MMRIKLQLILTTYFVNSGWTLFELYSPIADHAVTSNVDDAGGIRENTFNKMKEELRTAQQRNVNEEINLYKRSDTGKDNGVVKREAEVQADAGSARLDRILCNMLRNNITKYNAEGMVATLNKQYLRYTEVPFTGPASLESLVRKFEECKFEIKVNDVIKEPYMDKPNKTLPVGVLQLRTLNETVNIAIKVKHLLPACTLIGPLLKILKSDHFNELYEPTEKIMLFLFSYGLSREHVINEWMVFYYQNGDIVDTYHNAECLMGKEVRDEKLQFKDKHILQYFKNIPIEPLEEPAES